ncbi:coiled-coil domain-containing protein 117 isoform X2 [Sardina pilchardus]|uniref:coiled-coil domain-containing protein 117 isoform X2 n=1 Tax=Sardina pilchardus TaxID=27697 RepID=UPI002E147FA1
MHHPSPASSELGFFPPPFSPHRHIPELIASKDSTSATCHFSGADSRRNTSWERRCLRKHRRRTDDEACSPKRRRLTGEELAEDPKSHWSLHCSAAAASASVDATPALPQPDPRGQHVDLAAPSVPSPLLPAADVDGSCMEVEAAQRRLQEIEERITLEDDVDEEDLDVEPAQRRPVLVLSDSLKAGLQRGIGDILPHNVAESVSHSCMQLVVWRPPEDAVARRLKDSLQRQRKQQQQFASRQSTSTAGSTGAPATPPPPPPPQAHLRDFGEGALRPGYGSSAAQESGEEDMEL